MSRAPSFIALTTLLLGLAIPQAMAEDDIPFLGGGSGAIALMVIMGFCLLLAFYGAFLKRRPLPIMRELRPEPYEPGTSSLGTVSPVGLVMPPSDGIPPPPPMGMPGAPEPFMPNNYDHSEHYERPVSPYASPYFAASLYPQTYRPPQPVAVQASRGMDNPGKTAGRDPLEALGQRAGEIRQQANVVSSMRASFQREIRGIAEESFRKLERLEAIGRMVTGASITTDTQALLAEKAQLETELQESAQQVTSAPAATEQTTGFVPPPQMKRGVAATGPAPLALPAAPDSADTANTGADVSGDGGSVDGQDDGADEEDRRVARELPPRHELRLMPREKPTIQKKSGKVERTRNRKSRR